MAKQLNVALDFTANTTQAKQQIQELQQLLTKVAYSTDLGVNPEQMQKASAAAKELAIHLNEAYNTSTGNYDLSKLNASLARSKTNVTELSNGLLQAGATGQQAFIKLAQSIAAADQPMITLNARLQDFLTTVKNTVKWQISSSMIHGVMGALQGAYGYAQDLNKSLNDIRIVTGHNIDYMDKFADKANKAAKLLSTSTLNYTDASLIYYQQGLSDQEVEDRTAVTIKMANAAGESAEKVSQQLTAVWNNFYDGSQSLEYYADVMTALGAATASSTDEIAEGLEKFAAVSNTVGLSYEYATSALATVTATTRQSADVVGTAFKTLFARIQDLELGETLDDGTTLGKYSQALDAVGVSIKNADGGLRDMDDILSDLGEKWNSLDAEGNPLISKDAKVALAQTVAGVRQYTQLMALMDNWDFMKENLETAKNATGTLTEQQKIYEESWEAANKRLKASFQGLYQDLIDDKFFVKLTDFLSDMVDGVDSFIDKIGGLKTVIIGILSIVTNLLSSRIQPAIDNIINNIQVMAGGANKIYSKIRNEMNEQINVVSNKYNLSDYDKQSLQNVSQLNIMKQRLADQTDRLSDSERRLAEITIQGFEMSQQEILKTTKQLSEYKTQVQELQDAIPDGGIDYSNKRSNRIKALEKGVSNQTSSEIDTSDNTTEIQILQQNLKELSDAAFNAEVAVDGSIKTISQKFMELGQTGQEQVIQGAEVFSDLINQLNPFSIELDKLSNSSIQSQTTIRGMKREIEVLSGSLPEVVRNSEAVNNAFKAIEAAQGPDTLKKALTELQVALKNTEINGKNVNQVLSQLGVKKQDINLIVNGYKEISTQEEKLINQQKDLNNQLNNFNPKHLGTIAENFVRLTSVSMSAVMSINSFKAGIESLTDPDLSGWEKFSSAIMSFSFAFGSLKSTISGSLEIFNNLKTSLYSNYATAMLEAEGTDTATAAKIRHEAVTWLQCAADEVHNEVLDKECFALGLVNLGFKKDVAAKIADAAATGGLSAAMKVLNAELKATILSLLSILGPILAVIAAITAIGAAIYVAVKRSQSFEHEIEQANEDLEYLETNLTNVKNAVNSVSSSLDGLKGKYDNLKELTYGTIEWRDAVFDLNTTMQDLIDKYGLVEGIDFKRTGLGVLQMLNAGYDNIANQNNDTVQKATTSVSSQKYRTEQLNLQDTSNEILANNKNVAVGKKKVKYSPRPNEYRWKEETITDSLSQDDIDKVVKASLDNPEFQIQGASQQELIDIAGLDKNAALIISSNKDTQEALDKLTVETSRMADSYENSVLNELLGRGLDLSGYDEEYRAGIGKAMAKDVIEYENSIIDQYSGNTKLSNEDVLNTLKELGMDISTITTDALSDFVNNNKEFDITIKDDEGNESTQKIDYDTVLANYAAEMSRQWGLEQKDNYYQLQEETKSAYQGIDKVNQTIGAQQEDGSYKTDASIFEDYGQAIDNQESYGTMNGLKSTDEIRENEEAISNLRAQIESVQPALADMFGIIDENNDVFDDILNDGEFLADNAGVLQKALDGDSEAVNDLRKKYNEYAEEVKKANIKEWMDSKGVKQYFEAIKDGGQASTGELESLRSVMSNNSEEMASFMGVSNRAFKAFLNKNGVQGAAAAAKALQKAVNGDTSELIGLRSQMGKDYVATLNIEDEQVKTKINNLTEELAALSDSNEFQVKIAADPEAYSQFVDTCNQIIADAGMTAEQAQEYFKSIGFDAVIEEKDIKGEEVEHSKQYAKFTGYEGGEPQFEMAQIDMVDKLPDTKGFAVKSITPSGSAGGDITQETETVNSSNGDGENGGGSGGGDSYAPPPPKEYDDEIERYHVIKQKIEDLQEVMDHLAKAKDRAFGTSKLELMDQEIEKYDEMIDLQNQYLDEINKYWEEDRTLIASYGAEFDDTGVIINYDEIMKRQIDKYNASIGRNEDADDAAEEAYDDFIEALEQYEETNNLRQDELEKLYDLQTELADVIFEKTQYKIEIKIAVKDDELEYLDYLLSKIEDDAYAAAEAIALIGDKTQNTLDKITTYQEGLMELLSNHGINSIEELQGMSEADLKAKGFTSDEIDQLREWCSELLSANQELLEMRDTIQEKVLDSFNQFSEDIEHQIELFDHYQNILEGVKDITSLLGMQLGEQSKIVVRNLNRSLMNNSINNLAGTKKELEALKQMRADAQAERDKVAASGDEQAIKKWDNTLQEIDDKINDAEESFLDSWQEALQRAKDIFDEEMDNIIQEFEKGIAPIQGTIDALQEAISQANDIEEQYLSDTDKTYELNKLRRQIEGSIEDTDIIAHKQALNKLQDELNKKLKDGSQISEYDLKILQSKYELELARQKLEDTQNNNEVVRLTRDNNGNWGYVYSADEDKIAEAEQEYEDKLNAYQKANEEYLKTLESNILQVQADYKEKLKEIELGLANGEITKEEAEARIANLNNWYLNKMQYLEGEYKKLFENSQDATEKFTSYYQTNTDNIKDTFEKTTLAIEGGYESLNAMFKRFWDSHDDILNNSMKLLDDFNKKQDEINQTAGIEGNFASEASGWSIKITGDSDKALADMDGIVKNATDSFKDVIKAAGVWEDIYTKKINSAIDRNEALVASLNKMVAQLSGMDSIDYSKYSQKTDSRSTATDNNIISTQHNSRSFNRSVEVPDYISQFSYLDMLDQLDINKQIEDWMSNNELTIDTALMDSLDISTILQNIGLNVQTIVSYLSNLTPSSLGIDRIAQEFMQQVSINADFPNVTNSNEIMEAFEMMENEASQYASRKTI